MAFSEAARVAGAKVRRKNALLRKKGLLPPARRAVAAQAGKTANLNGRVAAVLSRPGRPNEAVILRLLALLEKLL